MTLYNDVLDYLKTLRISQGRLAGQPLDVLAWQRRFIRGALGSSESALSVARGNGKSTLVSALACAALDGPLAQPRGETVIVASSFMQARICGEHCLSFMADKLSDKSTWRVIDSLHQFMIEHRQTGARVRCIGSDPKRAHGLAPALVLADEPSQWEAGKSESMIAALRTGLGKLPDTRLIALGTRPADESHWFSRMLDGGGDYSQLHAARPDDPTFQRTTWKRANPSLDKMPDLESAIRKDAKRGKSDPSALASFEGLRLNKGV